MTYNVADACSPESWGGTGISNGTRAASDHSPGDRRPSILAVPAPWRGWRHAGARRIQGSPWVLAAATHLERGHVCLPTQIGFTRYHV